MDRRLFINSALLVAADLELLDRLSWTRRLFPGFRRECLGSWDIDVKGMSLCLYIPKGGLHEVEVWRPGRPTAIQRLRLDCVENHFVLQPMQEGRMSLWKLG